MDPRPIQRVAPAPSQPSAAPASRPPGDSANFASELVDALRGYGGNAAASNTVAFGADGQDAANPLDPADLSMADPFGFGDGGSISTQTIATRTEQLEKQFTARLDSLFAEQGIDKSVPIELRSDAFGRVRVVGDHPDAEKIEALFENSFELQQTFMRISGAQSLLRAAEQHEAFAAAYAEDPQGATTRFGHLFNATAPDPDFRMTISEGEWSTQFE